MADGTKVAFVSLGCAKNLVDSEKMLGQLAEAGCILTPEDQADVLVVNTCGFLADSRSESDGIIADAVRQKRDGSLKRVVVAGCLVQRDQEAILERLEGVDALVGVNNRDDIVAAVMGVSPSRPNREPDVFLSDYHAFTQLDTARLRLTPRHFAYLRISEGCDQKCTFCTIPAIRGPMHCKPPGAVLAEARELVADGAVELHLIGQDTTSYGLGDHPYDTELAGLLRLLDTVDGLSWIRLMYVYPSVMTDAIIKAIAQTPRVCKYVDMPLQHISDAVLKAMHRQINRDQTLRLLDELREHIEGLTLRTTMIVGFPGETDEQFEELCAFVREFRFDALGVFTYSREMDTPAGRMKRQIPEDVKQQRYDHLMALQQEVAFSLADERLGQTVQVLVDGRDESGSLVGRHEGQAPTVDSLTILQDIDAQPGDLITVRLVARDGYDLVARPAEVALPILGS
ncbi:MAG: 30S ribosomal protein S12 methylthiotransferase RimO [Phycisphaerae bacterium]